jgi:uncharacterized protein YecE (DUF72 family)
MDLQTRTGTSGYSYKAWKGTFYPEGLSQDEWLSYYASQLPSVEINNTFYRMPRTHVVEAWRDAVPSTFRFVIKASRRITHQSRLKDCEEPTVYLLKRAETMGRKLGAILFQLPPYMRADLDRLKTFQELLPESRRVAFEFRHDSWLDADVDSVLRARNHARVITHNESDKPGDIPDNKLAYLRLRAFKYTDAALRKWQSRISASGAQNAFVFFKHEDDGAGPAMASRYLEIANGAKPRRTATKRTDAGAKPARAAPRKVKRTRKSKPA